MHAFAGFWKLTLLTISEFYWHKWDDSKKNGDRFYSMNRESSLLAKGACLLQSDWVCTHSNVPSLSLPLPSIIK